MTAPLRLGLVDDEPPAIRRLALGVADWPDVEVAGVASDGAAALDMIETQALDVVLLDIEMPRLSGVELLRRVPRRDPPVFIFVTAYSRYATDAFDLAACDYLLKPVEFPRLRQALDRARDALSHRRAALRMAELDASAVAAPAAAEARAWLTEIWAPERDARVRVPVDQVDWIEAERDYVRVHSRGRSFLLRKSIRDLEAELDPAEFLRVHRAALVRRDRVVRIARRAGGLTSIVLQSGAEVPVARRLTARVRRLAVGGD